MSPNASESIMAEAAESKLVPSSVPADEPSSAIVSSSRLQDHHEKIPLVQLELQNITYSPLTKSSQQASCLSRLSCFRKASSSSSQQQPARTTVLQNVSTQILPHQVSAWMGPSGSGKTSLLTVAANLASSDPGALSVDSSILVNGQEGEIPKRLVGVVWQDDLLLSNLTVAENVWYAARLKTPQSVPDVQVQALVQATLQDLDLTKVQHSLVGNHQRRGVSGGERKRVAVASELVVRPPLLFLDEPTSGLDATTALGLMQTLKTLARSQGHSIVTVIHQPRTSIFNHYIDSLLLLSRGRVVYNGHPSQVRPYLEGSCGGTVAPLPPETGIADWIMDVIKEDEQKQLQNKNNNSSTMDHESKEAKGEDDEDDDDDEEPKCLADYWQRHLQKEESMLTQEQQQQGREHEDASRPLIRRELSTLEELEAAPKYNVNFATQFKLLTQRTMKQQRGERLTMTAAMLQCIYLFFTALFWWRLPDNTRYIFERNSLFFFMLVAQGNGVVISAVTVFATERTLLARERAKKMYGVASYFLSKTLSDMSNNVLLPVVYTMIVYWTANYRPTAEAYVKFLLTYYLIYSTAQSMGLTVSVAIPNVQLALVLAPPLTLLSMILGGFYVRYENMSPAVEWLSWLSFCRYGYSALIINEYSGRSIPCDDEFEEITEASVCPLPGEDVIESFGIVGVADNYWFNIGMIVLLQLVFRLSTYWMLRRSK